MKLLIVSQYFWPENFQINDIAKTLIEQGHEVDVLTGQPNYPDGKIFGGYKACSFKYHRWNRVNIFRMPLIPRKNSSTLFLTLNYISFIISTLLFSPIKLRRKQYDVIFVYGVSPIFQALPAILLGRLKKIPVALWIQDLWPESLKATNYIKSKFWLGLVNKLVLYIYKKTNLILVQSEAFIDRIESKIKHKKVLYHPNSVGTIFFSKKNTVKVNLKSLKSGFNIVFTGNIGAAQSLHTIIKSAELLMKYKEIKFIFFGSGSKLSWLKSEISKKKLKNIIVEGRYPINAMPSIMSQSSALLVSLVNEEIFSLTIPNKIQAYMTSGKPIIASLNGEGARLVKKSKAGITCSAEDYNELTNGIINLYKMTPQERIAIGKNGKRFCNENFYMPHLCRKLVVKLEHLKKD